MKQYPILLLFTGLLLASCVTDAPYKAPTGSFTPEQMSDGWLVDTPEAKGLSIDVLEDIHATLHDEDQFFNTKSLLIARGGKLVYEDYIQDQADRDIIGHVQSMTKSLNSLVMGIALHEGYIDSLNQPIVDLIPAVYPSNDTKQDITVRNLLTMTSGLDIDNSIFSVRMYIDKPANIAEYILDLPLYADPGTRFYYRDCDPHLLSYIIGEQSGQALEDIARDRILEPLGIDDYHWGSDHNGTSMGSHGFHAKPRDLLKIGQLVLQNGSWAGEQLIDSTWIAESTQLQIETPQDYSWNYGYYWWMVPEFNGFSAWGHGGNFIMVLPDYDMVLVLTSMPDTNDEMVGSTLDQFENLIRPLIVAL